MKKRQLVGWALATALTIPAFSALAQLDEGPILHPKSTTAKSAGATLLVICDIACNWKLDGKTRGAIAAGDSAKAPLSLGQHLVGAITQDGLDKKETEIEIKTVSQIIVHFVLQPVRDVRVKAEQEAQVKAQEQAVQEQAAKEQQDKERQARERAAHEEIERQAEVLYKDLRYGNAKPLLDQACAEDSAKSCNYLGLMYAFGRDVTKNEAMAKTLYAKACGAGSADGCYNLGCILSAGLEAWGGPAEDHPRAAALFSKACDAGHAEACYRAGQMYNYGQGVTQNIRTSVSLYTKACDAGIADGCYWVGSAYYNGEGIEKNDELARRFFGKACSLGSKNGCDMAH